MSETKAYDSGAASGAGYKSLLADPLALATKPAIIFKFASSVSVLCNSLAINQNCSVCGL